MTDRTVERVLTGRPASDGGGVRLTRVISPEQRLDPFLLLDEFDSSRAGDYIAGFPAHPHRGFETVTYMLDGHMLHEDHLGNRGDLTAGAVQWMTAGRGIIHSEMPQQTHGRMRGFQLWINLPAVDKLRPAAYQDLAPERIPTVELPGARVRVVAGAFEPVAPPSRPVVGPIGGGATAPLYFDVALDADARLTLATPPGHRLLIYAFEGNPEVGGRALNKGQLAILTPGTALEMRAGAAAGRVLVLGGKPLGEPVVHYGPFVMNTVAEIEQAIRDYQSGQLTAAA
ncbi:MAG TPA: pirin family protein [Steroidobacteraceae bacterium]|nr:pirin family protein [Steroidobacteraceae bacterium]